MELKNVLQHPRHFHVLFSNYPMEFAWNLRMDRDLHVIILWKSMEVTWISHGDDAKPLISTQLSLSSLLIVFCVFPLFY